MTKLLSLLLIFPFYFCLSQHQVSLTFINKSAHPVDSIIILAPQKLTLGPIQPGQQFTQVVSTQGLDFKGEGTFPFYAYTNNKQWRGSWGFHDFGSLASTKESFLIFDNGISMNGNALPAPQEFRLHFYNASAKKVDSIFATNDAVLKVNEFSPRGIEVVYDYKKIEANPIFYVSMDGRVYSKALTYHDFQNWNYPQDFIHFQNDSLHQGYTQLKEPMEFIIDLKVKISDSVEAIQIENPAITKVYNFRQPKAKRIIFDFATFKVHPKFTVRVKSRNYTVDLSTHDFSNHYYTQRIFFLEETGVKSL